MKLQWQYTANATLKHSTGAYNKAIYEEFELDGNPLAGRVLCTHPAVHWLEDGHMGSFDMKKALQTSSKVKYTKEGKRYLVIPLRHGTPGTVSFRSPFEKAGTNQSQRISGMPKSVYEKASSLGIYLGGIDKKTLRRTTHRKKRMDRVIKAGSFPEFGFQGKAKRGHKADPFAGMVRIPRQGGGSEYITFRVMSEDSPGWIHPGNPPLRIAERTRARSEAPVLGLIEAAVALDVARLEKDISYA